jgi:hypothetical protein
MRQRYSAKSNPPTGFRQAELRRQKATRKEVTDSRAAAAEVTVLLA